MAMYEFQSLTIAGVSAPDANSWLAEQLEYVSPPDLGEHPSFFTFYEEPMIRISGPIPELLDPGWYLQRGAGPLAAFVFKVTPQDDGRVRVLLRFWTEFRGHADSLILDMRRYWNQAIETPQSHGSSDTGAVVGDIHSVEDRAADGPTEGMAHSIPEPLKATTPTAPRGQDPDEWRESTTKMAELRTKGIPWKNIAEQFNMSEDTAQRHVRRLLRNSEPTKDD